MESTQGGDSDLYPQSMFSEKIYHKFAEFNPAECSLKKKQCRSKSVGFIRSQLIRIHTVFHLMSEFIIMNGIIEK